MAHEEAGGVSSELGSVASELDDIKAPSAAQRFIDVVGYIPQRCRYDPKQPFKFTFALNILFTFTATFTTANIYYNYPILHKISESFDVSHEKVAIVPTLMQAGYAVGVLFLNPLGDLVRRRVLVLSFILFTMACWVVLCVTDNFYVFAGVSFVAATFTVTPQLMLPLVGDVAPPAKKATAISLVLSGILFGMLMGQIMSGVVTEYTNWRTIYWISLGLQAFIFASLWLFMPDYPSTNPSGLTYLQALASLFVLCRKYPSLIQAALTGLCISAVFTMYWTSLTFLLIAPPYNFGSLIIGLFGLVGVGAILLAPVVGRYVIGRFSPSLGIGLGLVTILTGQLVGTLSGTYSVASVSIQAFLIYLGYQTTHGSNRTAIYKLDASASNRLNCIYMAGSFSGQVAGTGTGALLFQKSGWFGSGFAGVGFVGLGLVIFAVRGPKEPGWIGWRGGWRMEVEKTPEAMAESGESGEIVGNTAEKLEVVVVVGVIENRAEQLGCAEGSEDMRE